MTSTSVDKRESAADRAQTLLDWTRVNSTALSIGAVVVLVAAGVYWFYSRSRQIQAENAAKALLNAKQSMASGNLPLAQNDLQTVYSRYGSTPSGVEAAMLLAQMDYDAGKYQDGLNILQKAGGSSAAADDQSTILSLQGDGYTQLNQLGKAAKQYEDAAAAAAGMQMEHAFLEAKAARTYAAAGDTAKARQLWTQLATDPNSQGVAAEARVRLGELTAQVAKK